MTRIIHALTLTVLTIHAAYADKQPLPDDVKALMNGGSGASKRWHRYHTIPPLRVGQKASVIDGDTVGADCMNCPKIIAHFEKKYGIPGHLMLAISRVESRCRPWAVHHNGTSLQFKKANTALAFLKTASGNIQVGCMQLDVNSHRRRFKNTEMMMKPYYNIEFAAKLLRRLYKRHGSWERAVSFYHAASPTAQKAYCKRIAKQLAYLRGSKKPKEGDSWI